jgi:glycosyltransferase involved in cell wall biosynthesis
MNSSAKRSLRIVFVAPFGLKHKTTVWARTLPIARELAAVGHQVIILIPPWDSPEDAGKEEMRGEVRMVQLSLDGGVLGTVRRMVRAIDAYQPDIIHIVKPRAHAGLAQWWLWHRRRKEAKIVLDVDDWEQAWNPINRYNWFVARFLTWQEEWGIRHADAVTAASRWLENKVSALAPQIPILYLPNGVNPLAQTSINAPAPSITPKVLFFTRLVEVSATWLGDFWQALLAQVPSAELIIAGTSLHPWLADPFHAVMDSLPQVHWAGFVPPDELPHLYARATCAIFPALPVPLQQAKCSVRLATTMLYGVPVIASDVGEQSQYGADGAALLVPAAATPAQFAQAVAKVLCDPAQNAHTRSQATAQMLARYSWTTLTAPLPAFYESILGQR